MKIIFLIMIGLSLLQADFTRIGNIVKDSVLKLEWQDNEIDTLVNWQTAIDRCENLILDGHDDWRLPNVNELKIIVDRSKYNPAIVDRFTQTSSIGYWSSTSFQGYKGDAWIVYFYYGYVGKEDKDIKRSVRCVRGGE